VNRCNICDCLSDGRENEWLHRPGRPGNLIKYNTKAQEFRCQECESVVRDTTQALTHDYGWDIKDSINAVFEDS
jgi:hypothetical protein